MNKIVVFGAIIVGVGVAGGGGYYYMSSQAEQNFQEKIKVLTDAYPGSTLTYENHHINIFSKEVMIDKAVFKDKNGMTYTIDKTDIILGSGNTIPKLTFDKLVAKNKVGTVTIDHLDLTDAAAETGWITMENGKIKQIFPSKLSYGLLNVQNIEFIDNRSSQFKIGQYQVKNYGLGKKSDITLNELSLVDRRSNFKISALKVDQANLAEIAKGQEEFVQMVKKSRDSTVFLGIFNNISMIQFDLFSIDNLQFSERSDLTMKVGHYDLKNYGLGRKVSQSLQDISVSSNDEGKVYFRLASFTNEGADIATLIKAMGKLGFGSSAKFEQLVAKLQKDYLEQVGELKVHTNIAGLQLNIDKENMSLGSLTIDSHASNKGKTEEFYTLVTLEFTVPDYGYGPYLQAFKVLGYNKISVSGALKAEYQYDTNQIAFSFNQLAFKDIGTINATIKGNIPFGLSYGNPETILSNPDIKFSELTIRLQNTGIIEKIIKKMCEDQGISEEDAKKALISSAQERIKAFEEVSPSFVKEADKAVEIFIQNPQKTEIQFTSIPKAPVSAADLSGENKQNNVEMLNIHMNTQAVPVIK